MSNRIRCRITSVVLAAALACGAELAMAGAKADKAGAAKPVSLLNLTANVPANWEASPPSSGFRLAQFKTPGSPGAPGADMIVYYFGQGQGGDVASNIARWESQFTSAEGKPVKAMVEKFKAGGLPVTTAELAGTYDSQGMGTAAGPTPDQALVAAIVETPKGNITFQLKGPKAAVTANKSALLTVIKGLK